MGAAEAGASPAGGGAAGAAGPSCGNGAIDSGETCDPIEKCPTMTTCRSAGACLSPMLMGSASTCTATCEQVEIVMCVAGDGCCPKDCNHALDSDCSASCGDGVVTGDETCEAMDPKKPCPESCDDMDPCTKDMKTGTPAQCNVVCTHMPIVAPSPGDMCCPPGANAANDSDCMTKCGDGVVTGSETCDSASTSQPCETRSSCQPNGCMGATFSGDPATCTAKCDRKMITARQGGDGCCPPNANQANDSDCPQKCGDGVKTGSETCDPCESAAACQPRGCASATFTGSASDCTAQCTRGTIRTARDNDDCCPPNANVDTDSDCRPHCGDGVMSSGETCDSGSGGPPCISESACLSKPSSGGCPKFSGSASQCTSKCSYDAPLNACGGCKKLLGTPNTDCLTFLSEPSCLAALWRCDKDLVGPNGDPDTVACSCQMRMM